MKKNNMIYLKRRVGKKQKQKRLVSLGVGGAGVIIALILAFWPNAYRVTIDGVEVGAVKEKQLVEEAIASVEAQLRTTYETEVELEGEIDLKRTRASKKDIITPNYLMTYMRTNMDFTLEFRQLSVDGEPVAIVESDAIKDELLERLKEEYFGNTQDQVRFVNDIELEPIFANEAELTSIDELVQIATRQSRQSVTYEVVTGDTLWGIATKLGTTVENLQNTNEGLSERINIGDTIDAEVTRPFIELELIPQPEEEDDWGN